MVTDHLLATKLYVPRGRSETVRRARLKEKLGEGTQRKLTLVSAPAGSGKTTLLGEWCTERYDGDREFGWLSLDENDNDPARFLSYLTAALGNSETGIGKGSSSLLISSQRPSAEMVLTALVNEVAISRRKVFLVLDDYHVVENEEVHAAMAFLLDHLPPNMHLIIASRTEPPLPLSRLRASGQMMEIGSQDLRFTPQETADFFENEMGIALPDESIAVLAARTEGWGAGLQLAALSLQQREDTARFVEAFAGSNRYVFDYLADEVLSRQPEDVQRFLLETSILERLSPPLCKAVTGHPRSREMLEKIREADLFIIPLDEEERWYRYHHLFVGFLETWLRRSRPEVEPGLHRRASDWYELEGFPSEAVGHAIAANEVDRAAELVERYAKTMLSRSELATLAGWIEALPPELVRSRPRLSVTQAWIRAIKNQIPEIEPLVHAAERTAEESSPSTTGLPVSGYEPLLGEIATLRAHIALNQGEFSRSIELSQRALELTPEEDTFVRGAATTIMGGAQTLNGEVVAASQSFTEAARIARRAENIFLAVTSMANLAPLEEIRGRLGNAREVLLEALELATGRNGRPLPAAALPLHGLGTLAYEWNDLETAGDYLQQSVELARASGAGAAAINSILVLATVSQSRGDVEGAEKLIRDAERAVVDLDAYATGVIAAYRARLLLAQGKTREASRWAEESGLGAEDELHYQQELSYKTFARVRAAQGRTAEALHLLNRLISAADQSGRTGSRTRLLAIKAPILLTHRDRPGALTTLERALTLAEPEGYVRTFVDEGEPMVKLLSDMRLYIARDGAEAHKDVSPGYVGQLLALLQQPLPVATPPGVRPLSNPLSGRELEVLRLVSGGMKNAEIARHLFVVEGTVKTHLNNAYRKLEVKNRTQAIARATELGLL